LISKLLIGVISSFGEGLELPSTFPITIDSLVSDSGDEGMQPASNVIVAALCPVNLRKSRRLSGLVDWFIAK
jgi:hypothetical protein